MQSKTVERMIFLKNKNGIPMHQKRKKHLDNKLVVGYKKRVRGIIIEIFVDKRSVQSNKMITEGWKPIYE